MKDTAKKLIELSEEQLESSNRMMLAPPADAFSSSLAACLSVHANGHFRRFVGIKQTAVETYFKTAVTGELMWMVELHRETA